MHYSDKEGIYMKKVSCLFLTILIICCCGCGKSQEHTAPVTEISATYASTAPTTSTDESTVSIVVEYDSLQQIFIAITPDSGIEMIEEMVADYGLCFTEKEYNKSSGGKKISYKIAYTEGAAKQSHADPGDYLDITFDKETGTLMTAQYVCSESTGSALLYCHGTWFSFSEKNAQDYSGYYWVNSLAKEDGIIVKYQNGNDIATKYFPYDSAENLIQKLMQEK